MGGRRFSGLPELYPETGPELVAWARASLARPASKPAAARDVRNKVRCLKVYMLSPPRVVAAG